jgi:cysteine-rich repeat protein
MGQAGEVSAFFWMQGEADAGSAEWAAAYEANLTQFVAQVQADFSAPHLPFVRGRLNVHIDMGVAARPFLDTVRAAQEAVAATLPRTVMVDTDDLALNGDLVQFSAAGQMGLGQRFADAFLALGAFCGDGVVDPGEECDDGNGAGGDCCSPSCRRPVCTVASRPGKSRLVLANRPGKRARRALVQVEWESGDRRRGVRRPRGGHRLHALSLRAPVRGPSHARAGARRRVLWRAALLGCPRQRVQVQRSRAEPWRAAEDHARRRGHRQGAGTRRGQRTRPGAARAAAPAAARSPAGRRRRGMLGSDVLGIRCAADGRRAGLSRGRHRRPEPRLRVHHRHRPQRHLRLARERGARPRRRSRPPA